MSAETARRRASQKLATSAGRRVTFPVTAPRMRPLGVTEAPPRARSATVAARLGTLPATAPRRPAPVGTATHTVPLAGTRTSNAPATPAAVLDTCRVIACRRPSATTALASAISAKTARNLSGGHATPAVRKDTSRATAPRPTLRPRLRYRLISCSFVLLYFPLRLYSSTRCRCFALLSVSRDVCTSGTLYRKSELMSRNARSSEIHQRQ
ncbi:hypothetical protein WOLCODRAFT_135864 [Wolfiporia cocos MD-104 SS10]|uniref:Uncharacterized protein n=1 Tax=Wolfiporia cocos (strain MD-104) TaxID=742152 RepID=A0A2H3JJ97_WOLCO|nr:hypothetical protein WOLCODRAFT_135864 [Wolfiporia cocos MD-104 SS10]